MFTTIPRQSGRHIAPPLHLVGEMALSEPISRSQSKRAVQDEHRAWLQELVKAVGLKPSQLADKAGVSDSTITRLLNNPEYTGTLSQVTINRIKERFSVHGPGEQAGGRRLSFGLAEAERIDAGEEPPAVARILKEMLKERPNFAAWRLKTYALEEAGYLAGDIVIVDPNLQPQAQDVVAAQVYDHKGGGAETIWRIYNPPFLVAATLDRTAFKPMLVDNDRVVVRGVVVESFRPHRLSATR